MSIPVPSIRWPSRSTVIPCDPMTRPLPMQSTRSFWTMMLCTTISPHVISRGTGAAAIVHVWTAGDMS